MTNYLLISHERMSKGNQSSKMDAQTEAEENVALRRFGGKEYAIMRILSYMLLEKLNVFYPSKNASYMRIGCEYCINIVKLFSTVISNINLVHRFLINYTIHHILAYFFHSTNSKSLDVARYAYVF